VPAYDRCKTRQARIKVQKQQVVNHVYQHSAQLNHLGLRQALGPRTAVDITAHDPHRRDPLQGRQHIRMPYVLGGVWNATDKPKLGERLVDNGHVRRRGLVSRSGHMMVFCDDDTSQSGVALMSADNSLRISMNQTATQLTVHSDGTIDVRSKGDMTLKADGNLTIKAGANLKLEGGANVKLKGGAVVDIDGALIQLN
jgi:hypothetical protein